MQKCGQGGECAHVFLVFEEPLHMKNFFKQIESKKEITASKLVKMRLRIVWSKTNGWISLKKCATDEVSENMILLKLNANYSQTNSETLRLGQQVRPNAIGR